MASALWHSIEMFSYSSYRSHLRINPGMFYICCGLVTVHMAATCS